MHYVGIGVTAVVPASGSDDCGGGVSPWTSRGTRPVIVRNCALRGATCADSNAAVGARCSALIDSLASPDAVATDTAVLDAIAKAISSVDVSAPRTSLGRTSPRFLRTAASWACLRMRAHEPAGARERASDTKMMLSNSQSVRQSGEGAWSVWAMESYDTTYSGPTDLSGVVVVVVVAVTRCPRVIVAASSASTCARCSALYAAAAAPTHPERARSIPMRVHVSATEKFTVADLSS